MVTAKTQLVGIIGWPVGHSRSPAMHNAAFAAAGLDWLYLPLPVRPERVEEAVAGLRGLGFVGANVTVPHKEAVIPFLDELTPTCKAVGSANTIIVAEGGRLVGETTDGYGFLRDLIDHGVETPRRGLVIGAGGAARAVVHALAVSGVAVSVCARRLASAVALCEAVGRAVPEMAHALTAGAFPEDLGRLAEAADLVVNATSLGLHDGDALPWDNRVGFQPGQVVYDLVYHRKTEFLGRAEAHGARAIGGLGMLVHQGAQAFELWTGLAAPVDAMRQAALLQG